MKKYKLCFLVSEYVPHQVTSIKALLSLYNIEILAFSYDRIRQRVPIIDDFDDYDASKVSEFEMFERIVAFNPVAIIASGWMYKKYTSVCKRIKRKSDILTVAYSDTPWYGRITQRINCLISPLYVKAIFDYIWVAGLRQYEYARRLGFNEQKIIFNSLTADTHLLNSISINMKKTEYPKNFIFIGRFVDVKGLNYLIDAWSEIEDKKGWTLTLIGNGDLKEEIINTPFLVIKDYMDQSELLQELQNSGCFILPSIYEPWALVLHEAAAAGLPIICTEICGAAPHFIYDYFNGFCVEPSSSKALKKAMVRIINTPDSVLCAMSENSRTLSNSITPEITAASLMQIILK